MLTPDIGCILLELADEEPDEAGASIEKEISRLVRPPVFMLTTVLRKYLLNSVFLLEMALAEVSLLLLGGYTLDVYLILEDGQLAVQRLTVRTRLKCHI